MFDIGFMELLIIGVVALVVVGPERLPTLVRTTGMWVGRLRRALSGVKREISEELRVEELRQQAKARQEAMEKEVDAVRKPFADSLRDEVLNETKAEPVSAEPEAHSINPHAEVPEEAPASEPTKVDDPSSPSMQSSKQ